MFERLSLTHNEQKNYFSMLKEKIEIFSTPFNLDDVDFLENLE